MKSKLLVLALLAGSTMFAGARVAIGVGIGVPYGGYPPPAYVEAPPCPGPGYSWVDGYWDYQGPSRYWHTGYWSAPVYAPRYYGGPRYYAPPARYYDRGYYGHGYDRGYRGHERYEHGYRDHGWRR